jgi:hypothetical protein
VSTLPDSGALVLLADDPGWFRVACVRNAAGAPTAVLLATAGTEAEPASREMAAELGRGEPWRVEDRRGQPAPTPGM